MNSKMNNHSSGSDLFLGFDLSTQQLKVIATDNKLRHLDTFAVEFDAEYATKYNVKKGVISKESTGEIVSPVAMWIDAIEFVFNQMKQADFPFHRVRGISGSAQQHGTVYWSHECHDLLDKLDPTLEKSLADQLHGAFAYDYSPNWQDHLTGQEIADFEKAVGGPDKLAQITGSRAHYRFSGLQIRKLAKNKDKLNVGEKEHDLNQKNVYKDTHRISLVSSFVASILLGKITNIEEADGCGMNLYNISKGEYDESLLALAAGKHEIDDVERNSKEAKDAIEELKQKLGPLIPVSHKLEGQILNYFVKKYGFADNTKIFPFTGDNLATILALPLAQNDVLISLGTSTTVLLVTKNYCPSQQYHLFKHPTLPDHYMGMICYCNGSLAREKIRDSLGGDKNWDRFDEILDNSPGFDDKLGIYFPLGEIVPNAAAQTKRLQWKNGKIVDIESWDPAIDVASIVELQTLSCRLRLGPMLASEIKESGSSRSTPETPHKNYKALISEFGEISTDGKPQTESSLVARPNKVYYVGGALKNISIVKKMAEIFGLENGNYRAEVPNACALGGAFKASWGVQCEDSGSPIDFGEYVTKNFDFLTLEEVNVRSKWEEYFRGLGMLARMESELKHE